jgi:hypothetical protein
MYCGKFNYSTIQGNFGNLVQGINRSKNVRSINAGNKKIKLIASETMRIVLIVVVY